MAKIVAKTVWEYLHAGAASTQGVLAFLETRARRNPEFLCREIVEALLPECAQEIPNEMFPRVQKLVGLLTKYTNSASNARDIAEMLALPGLRGLLFFEGRIRLFQILCTYPSLEILPALKKCLWAPTVGQKEAGHIFDTFQAVLPLFLPQTVILSGREMLRMRLSEKERWKVQNFLSRLKIPLFLDGPPKKNGWLISLKGVKMLFLAPIEFSFEVI